MRKFSGYSVCKVSLVYVLLSSTPPLVTRFFHWLCSDFVPFLLTKCLVCFAELNLYCFTRRNHWSGERIQAKEAQECHWLDFSQLLQRNPVLPSSTPPLVTRFSHWLCSDYVPFLLTKCLVCFAELNLHCFSSKKSLKQRKDSSKRSSGMPLAWL